MKALGRKTLRQKVELETEKFMNEKYQELAYNAIIRQTPITMQQTEAVLLYALSLHGYGTKRLRQIHEWYCEAMSMKEILGKRAKLKDVMELIVNKHHIDLDRISPEFLQYEEFKNEET